MAALADLDSNADGSFPLLSGCSIPASQVHQPDFLLVGEPDYDLGEHSNADGSLPTIPGMSFQVPRSTIPGISVQIPFPMQMVACTFSRVVPFLHTSIELSVPFIVNNPAVTFQIFKFQCRWYIARIFSKVVPCTISSPSIPV